MPLLARIALTVLGACLLSILPLEWWFRNVRDDLRREDAQLADAVRVAVAAAAAALRDTPVEDRTMRLSLLQQELGRDPQTRDVRLELVAQPAGEADASAPEAPPGHHGSLRMAVTDGVFLEARRPPTWRGPPDGGPPPFVIILLSTVVVVASLAVGVPLVRRIRGVERALADLAEGRFDTRLSVPAADALGGLPQALNRCAERLERLFEQRKELLEAVTHEIGTPLSRMRFQLELLASARTDDDRKARLDALAAEITELDALSSELVLWAEADGATLKPAQIPLAPFLSDLVDAEVFAVERPPAVAVEVEPELAVTGEGRQVGRAIENVVRNALRYARATVRVSAQARDGGVAVRVEDDGPGIPEDQRDRIFQPFVRLERSRSRAHGGMGLGLAIARRIVERHAGRVAVDRSPLGGASFELWFPGAAGAA